MSVLLESVSFAVGIFRLSIRGVRKRKKVTTESNLQQLVLHFPSVHYEISRKRQVRA